MAAMELELRGLKFNKADSILHRPEPGRESTERNRTYDMATSDLMISSADSFLRGIACTILDEAGPFWFGLGSMMQPRQNVEVVTRAYYLDNFFKEKKLHFMVEVRDGKLYADLHNQKTMVVPVSKNSVVEISLRDGTQDTVELKVQSEVVHTSWETPVFPLQFFVLVEPRTFGDLDVLRDLRWVGVDRVQLTDEFGIVEAKRKPGVLEKLRAFGAEYPAMIASEFCIGEENVSHPIRGGVCCALLNVAEEWMIGLATSANDRDVSLVDEDIDFALRVNDGTLTVFERNQQVSLSVPVNRGDEVRIMVKPQRHRGKKAATAQVHYWHNGRPIHKSRISPTFPLYAKIWASEEVSEGVLLERLRWVAHEPPLEPLPFVAHEPHNDASRAEEGPRTDEPDSSQGAGPARRPSAPGSQGAESESRHSTYLDWDALDLGEPRD